MPKVVNLHTRHDTRESPPLHQSHPRVHRAVLPAIRNQRETSLGRFGHSHVHLRFGRCTFEGVLSPPRGSYPTQTKPSPAAPKSLEDLRTAFIHDKKTTFKKDGTPLDPDTISSCEKVTRAFLDTVKKSNPAQVTRQDLKDWMVKQRERVSHRTVCNLYISIACFLHFCGVDHKKLLPQSERPSPVEETPEAYTEQEMTKFFFVITKERDALAFELILKTGPREQELANLEWEHLDLGKTPTVSYKTRDSFRAKTGKSRTILLERGLGDRLAEWRVKTPLHFCYFPRSRARSKDTSCDSVRNTPNYQASTRRSSGYTNSATRSPLGHYGATWTSARCSIGSATPALR
jgi:integrase